ncbi:amidohydrolase [Phytoactinopolyspora endophytica]|uniref:amidohydrolase n=1 Tax=Phytoactinopolyspora endophytica TaxID=1642495 RepID=UPI00101BF6FF|nr:amidohydrolase family protein [Phytoactinopolyspora endophytica]
MTSLLLRNARLLGEEEARDVRIVGDRITQIAPEGTLRDAVEEFVDLDGRVLAPGLWDEHVHFTQWTIRRSRFDLSDTRSAADALNRVREVLSEQDREPGVSATGYGFRDGTWPDAPSRDALDAITGGTPVILISGDLHCAWMNSAAAVRLGLELDESGLVREGPWLNSPAHLRDASSPTSAKFREAAEAAARRGVVGIVEFEHADNLTQWQERIASGIDQLRIEASIWPEYLDGTIAAGHRTGDPLESRGLVTMGRLKVVVDGSLNTRTAWCWDPYPGVGAQDPHPCGIATVPPDELRRLLSRAVPNGIAPAVHAIGDRANTEVIDIFEEHGIAGTIEHAQLVSEKDFSRFGALGLVASVQPEHAMDDRDVADRHWAGRTDRAFAFASLYAGGATLRLGSDAPVAPLDPWHAIAAATTRSREGREPWHPDQRVPLDVALAASMRGRTTVTAGDIADLAILDVDPRAATAEQLRELPVSGTLVGGRWTWRDL